MFTGFSILPQCHSLRMTGLRLVPISSQSGQSGPLCLLPTEHVVMILEPEKDAELLDRSAKMISPFILPRSSWFVGTIEFSRIRPIKSLRYAAFSEWWPFTIFLISGGCGCFVSEWQNMVTEWQVMLFLFPRWWAYRSTRNILIIQPSLNVCIAKSLSVWKGRFPWLRQQKCTLV